MSKVRIVYYGFVIPKKKWIQKKVVGVGEGETHFQHVQGEPKQLHGFVQEGHVAHKIDRYEGKNAMKEI
jgi:hypothetical protein